MSEALLDPLEKVIRKAGEGWLIDWYKPRENALPHLRKILSDANDSGKQKLGGNAPELTPEAIADAYERNPQRVRGFIQVITSIGSPNFLVMIWRIIQGMNIQAIKMQYQEEQPFSLHVRLVSPYGETENYDSNDIDDAVILRHLGIMKAENQGSFDGFYSLKR